MEIYLKIYEVNTLDYESKAKELKARSLFYVYFCKKILLIGQ